MIVAALTLALWLDAKYGVGGVYIPGVFRKRE